MNHLIRLPSDAARSGGPADRPEHTTKLGTFSSAVLIFAVALVLGSAFWWGERIAVNHGLGWDGCQYAAWAEDFRGNVVSGDLNANRAGRVLPSALVHYGFRLSGIPLTKRNIIRGFVGLDMLALISMAFFWSGIARQLSISLAGEWFGALCLFVSFAVLKMAPYLPVQTDLCAMALSLALVYCYLRNGTIAGVLLTLAGSFVWPGLIGQAAILQVFPRANAKTPARATAVAALLSVGLLTVLAAYVAWHGFGYRTPWLDAKFAWLGDSTSRPRIAVLAAICLALYLYLVLKELTNRSDYFRPSCWRRMLSVGPALVIVIFLLSRHWFLTTWPRGVPNFSAREMCVLLMNVTLRLPGLFFLAHVTYFGPVVILIALTWRGLCRELHSHGPGLPLAAGFGALLTLDPESRHSIHLIPLLVPFLVKAIDRCGWTGKQILSFAILAFIWSKVWFVLGGEPDAHWSVFPSQRFFMHMGPLMSEPMYYVHGLAALVCGGWLWYLFRHAARAETVTVSEGPADVVPEAA